MLPGEHQQVLNNLQSHFDEFLEDSEESEVFTVADQAQLEGDVEACKEYYQELLQSAERGKFLPLFLPTRSYCDHRKQHCEGNTWLV